MKGVVARCSVAAVAVVIFPLAVQAAGSADLSITATGEVGGSYAVGQTWTLDLASSFPGANFSLCAIDNHGDQSCTPWAVADGNGTWTGTGVFDASTVGQWSEWVSFPSQNVTSNRVTFTVSQARGGSAAAAPGTLNIAVDPNIPGQSPTVTPGGMGYAFALADLTAESAPITVNYLNWDCAGYACSSATNLRMIGAGPDDDTWYGSPSNAYAFTPNLVIPAGASERVELEGDIASTAPVGQQIQFSLASKSVNITGGSSITGGGFMNVLTVVSSSSAASAPSSPSADVCPPILQTIVGAVDGIAVQVNTIIASNVASPTSASPSTIASLSSALQDMDQSLNALLVAEGCGESAGVVTDGVTQRIGTFSVTGASEPSPPAATLTINGVTGGGFAFTEPWTLSIVSNLPNAAVTLCAIDNHDVQSCTPDYGLTNASGDWTLAGSFAPSTVGVWQEWAELGTGNQEFSSNHIYFTVD